MTTFLAVVGDRKATIRSFGLTPCDAQEEGSVISPDNEMDLFHASFARVTNMDGFFDDFYNAYLHSSEEVAAKFKDTDMVRQSQMMALALVHLVVFFSSRVPSIELQRLAYVHSKAQADIPPRLFDAWLEAMLATVERHDPEWNEPLEAEWREVLAPGIEYMKALYA